MRYKSRYLVSAVVLIAVMGLVGWWFWFPAAQEAGYEFVRIWGVPGHGLGDFQDPIGIAVAGIEVFVSDAGKNRIQVFDKEGQFLRQFGKEGGEPGELSRPMHLDIQSEKHYVAEYLNDRVQIFTFDGESLDVVGSSGSGFGQFEAPGGVAATPDGHRRQTALEEL